MIEVVSESELVDKYLSDLKSNDCSAKAYALGMLQRKYSIGLEQKINNFLQSEDLEFIGRFKYKTSRHKGTRSYRSSNFLELRYVRLLYSRKIKTKLIDLITYKLNYSVELFSLVIQVCNLFKWWDVLFNYTIKYHTYSNYRTYLFAKIIPSKKLQLFYDFVISECSQRSGLISNIQYVEMQKKFEKLKNEITAITA